MKKKDETKSITEGRELVQVTSVQSLLEKAVEGNVPIETVERLLQLRAQLKAEQARDVFFQAKAEFQGMVPPIIKRHAVTNKDGTLRYKFAKIDDITSAVQAPLAQCGLSYKWEIDFVREGSTWFEIATCIVTHEEGHSESSAFKVPVEFSTGMNNVQSFASAGTYAKRYALCNALGVSPDEDDDAQTISHIVEKEAKPSQPATTVQPPQRKPTTERVPNGAVGNPPEILEGEIVEDTPPWVGEGNAPEEHRQPAPPKERANDILLNVEVVTEKKTKTGGTKYGIKLNDGFFYNTFSKTFAAEAIRARNERRPVLVEWSEDEFGYKLENIEVQE